MSAAVPRNKHSLTIDSYDFATFSPHPEAVKVTHYRQWCELEPEEGVFHEWGEYHFEDGAFYRFNVFNRDLEAAKRGKDSPCDGVGRELYLPDGRCLRD